MLKKLLENFPSLRSEHIWNASVTGPKNMFNFSMVGKNLTCCKNKGLIPQILSNNADKAFGYITLDCHTCEICTFADLCILTIQRGKICVCVFPTWGHIDAAFRLLAFEYVSVGIEGCTAQTGSHLNKQAQQLITMSLEPGFLFLGSM